MVGMPALRYDTIMQLQAAQERMVDERVAAIVQAVPIRGFNIRE